MNCQNLTRYGADYCIVDTHNLFVGTTLEDEILLLGGRDELMGDMARGCSKFGLELAPGRKLSSYSGGEQIIICCQLLMHMLPAAEVRILLVHALETLSERNRELLLESFAARLPHASLYVLAEDGPQPLTHHA